VNRGLSCQTEEVFALRSLLAQASWPSLSA
jgi:hypothetical protein